jgi:type I restriction enzyme S subunit
MSLPNYPEYKKSGVEWLGEVPVHWTVSAIKWLSPVLRGASPRPIDDAKYFDDEGEYSWVRIADASASDGILLETTQRLSELGSSLSVKLEPGTLFVSIAGTVGKPCITGIKACIHDGFVHFPRLRIDQRFLYRLFESGACYAGLGKMGTQLNLNTDTIGSIRIALPPPAELQTLLSFLDRETAKIDALIAEQEKLLALLAEKRQATISHAVTKGLNPDVPMKYSGIPWLGEMPAHWDIVPLMRLTEPARPIMYGIVLPGPDVGEGIPILKGGNVKLSRMKLDEMARTTPDIEAPYARARLRAGDLVYSIRGSIGDCEVVPADLEGSNITQDVARIAIDASASAVWARWCLLSTAIREDLACGSLGAAVRGINIFDLKRARLPVPPPDEQVEIASFIEREVSKLDQLRDSAEHAIDLLTERRSALIAAAVTGKIDVRGAMPDEAAIA